MPFLAVFFAVEVDLLADFFAVDVPFLAVFFAVEVDLLAVFLAVDFFAGDFLAADFLAVEAFFAVLFFAAEAFLAGADFFAVDLFAVFLVVPPPAARFAAAAVRADGWLCGGRRCPLDRGHRERRQLLGARDDVLELCTGRKAGTAFFFAFIRAPVEGFRTHRASRTFFSKEPKPVMATFSPLATSRVIVSSTESSACAAALRLPS